MRRFHAIRLRLLLIGLLCIGTSGSSHGQVTGPLKGAVKVASLPVSSDSSDVWDMEWISNARVKIVSSRLAGPRYTWYTIDIRSGQKSTVHVFKY